MLGRGECPKYETLNFLTSSCLPLGDLMLDSKPTFLDTITGNSTEYEGLSQGTLTTHGRTYCVSVTQQGYEKEYCTDAVLMNRSNNKHKKVYILR